MHGCRAIFFTFSCGRLQVSGLAAWGPQSPPPCQGPSLTLGHHLEPYAMSFLYSSLRLKGLAFSRHLLETAVSGVPFWSAPGPPLSPSCPPKWGSACSLETREHRRLRLETSVHHAEMMTASPAWLLPSPEALCTGYQALLPVFPCCPAKHSKTSKKYLEDQRKSSVLFYCRDLCRPLICRASIIT